MYTVSIYRHVSLQQELDRITHHHPAPVLHQIYAEHKC